MERRDFFRVAGPALASLSLLGFGAADASAMTVGSTTPLERRVCHGLTV